MIKWNSDIKASLQTQGLFWSLGIFPAAGPGVREPSLVWVSKTLPLELPPDCFTPPCCVCENASQAPSCPGLSYVCW